ncbi:MAG: hypothetical protein QM500_16890 [Methylococcales bacterium]
MRSRLQNMSKLLLYITLFITSPACIGEVHELSSKSNLEKIDVASIQEELGYSQTNIEPDDKVDSLHSELHDIAYYQQNFIYSRYQFLLFSQVWVNEYRIRAPPSVS